ncbi:MAG: P1 family peptidase [Rhodothermales bacterium]
MLVFMGEAAVIAQEKARPRAREIGIEVGILPTGPLNAITDLEGVKIGHKTLWRGDSVRTGVTVIMPHGDNLFQEKVPAAIYLGNAFGKLAGSTQVEELGNIETPIALTNTLSVPTAVQALIRYTLQHSGNESVRSVNAVVGETNDGGLNDIRGLHVTETDVIEAIESAATGPVEEGAVGAGTGTSCFGFKCGIGTSSRQLPGDFGGYTVGVLVQTNYGGVLTINGAPVGRELGKFPLSAYTTGQQSDGSCMIVVGTNAPLSPRNLKRLAKRAVLGMGQTGSPMFNGSGDFVIAFSTAYRVPYNGEMLEAPVALLSNNSMSLLFMAVVEATEEAIYNSMFKAISVTGRDGRTLEAIAIDRVVEISRKYNLLNLQQRLPGVDTSVRLRKP